MTQAPVALSDFPPPPAHFRLFEPPDGTSAAHGVLIPPPNIPRPNTTPHVFGQVHSLDPPPLPIDSDEMLFDPEENLRTSLLQLHRELQVGSVSLLRCLVNAPSEHDKHARHVNRLMRNMQALLRNVRSREARMLVLQRMRDQVARKQAYVQTVARALPAIEARAECQLGTPVARSTDAPSAEELTAWAALEALTGENDDEMSLDSNDLHPQPPNGVSDTATAKDEATFEPVAPPEGGGVEASQQRTDSTPLAVHKRSNDEHAHAPREKCPKLSHIQE